MISTLVVLLCLLAGIAGSLRWFRVMQREHYLAGAGSRFAVRWWGSSSINVVLLIIGVAGIILAGFWPLAGLATAGVALIAPIGLSLRGRTSQLAWTRRLRTLAASAACIAVVVVAIGAALGLSAPAAALTALAVPLLLDLAAMLVSPIEARAAGHFVEQATYRLARVAPRVVGITGSYGKTSTKNHLSVLLGSDLSVVPTPRSFNNRAGLARAINENLADGTDVFIAEMGTYGPGEIAEMCSWCPPAIAVITAVGPVHLERFGDLEVTLAAKAEITRQAERVVLNVDDERLARLAEMLATQGKKVIKVGSEAADADIQLRCDPESWAIVVEGVVLAETPAIVGVQPTNVACALGAAMALGLDPTLVAQRVALLKQVESRLGVTRAPSGVTVIDDTFNSNPAGAAAALDVLAGLEIDGRRVVVTPGMIELGRVQSTENEAFARRLGEVADTLVIVRRSNRASLRRGAASTPDLEVIEVADRRDAVAWVRSMLGPDDAVLYENDLPDNYP